MKNVELKYTIYRKIIGGGANAPLGPPLATALASHMSGVWKRQIRSARSILLSLLKIHSQSLNDEKFCTLMAEVEGIMNSRPLTVEIFK